jgi:hypothetical protein
MGFFTLLSVLSATTVKGPDGFAFFIFLLILISLPILFLIYKFIRRKNALTSKSWHSGWRKKIEIEVKKDRKYYPDIIQVSVKNTGKSDVDLIQPLLIFRNFWSKRKFRVKGTNRYSFYPLLLEPGSKHELKIDLNHFYRHDKRLKRYPRITVVLSDINGKTFAPKSIMLRKTLFR